MGNRAASPTRLARVAFEGVDLSLCSAKSISPESLHLQNSDLQEASREMVLCENKRKKGNTHIRGCLCVRACVRARAC